MEKKGPGWKTLKFPFNGDEDKSLPAWVIVSLMKRVNDILKTLTMYIDLQNRDDFSDGQRHTAMTITYLHQPPNNFHTWMCGCGHTLLLLYSSSNNISCPLIQAIKKHKCYFKLVEEKDPTTQGERRTRAFCKSFKKQYMMHNASPLPCEITVWGRRWC